MYLLSFNLYDHSALFIQFYRQFSSSTDKICQAKLSFFQQNVLQVSYFGFAVPQL